MKMFREKYSSIGVGVSVYVGGDKLGGNLGISNLRCSSILRKCALAYTRNVFVFIYLSLRMLALPVSEIGNIFGTLLGFTLQPHVKIVPI